MNSDLTWVDVAHYKLAFDWFILVMRLNISTLVRVISSVQFILI